MGKSGYKGDESGDSVGIRNEERRTRNEVCAGRKAPFATAGVAVIGQSLNTEVDDFLRTFFENDRIGRNYTFEKNRIRKQTY